MEHSDIMSKYKHIDASIKFLHSVYKGYINSQNGLYLANSGGKDSVVCYHLLKRAGLSIPIIHGNTTFDPPGTLKYIREYMPETLILTPPESFLQLVTRKGLPTRLNRYCCKELKEKYGAGKNTIEGVRAAESTNRTGRDYIECDRRKDMHGAQHIYPIYDWTDTHIWDYIKDNNIQLAPHYAKGFCRLGCVACPQVTRKGIREAELEAYPKYRLALEHAIAKGMANNPHWKISRYTNGNGAEAIDWWLTQFSMRDWWGYDIPFIRKTSKNELEQREGPGKGIL